MIDAEAKDCSGNVVDTETQDSGDSVDVIDATPPEVTSSNEDLFCLWPPEHDYVCFDAAEFMPEITDNCDPTPTWEFDACTSDQPDNGPGDGDTVNDCVLDGDAQGFCARAERMGSVAPGRRYDLDITATDFCDKCRGRDRDRQHLRASGRESGHDVYRFAVGARRRHRRLSRAGGATPPGRWCRG